MGVEEGEKGQVKREFYLVIPAGVRYARRHPSSRRLCVAGAAEGGEAPGELPCLPVHDGAGGALPRGVRRLRFSSWARPVRPT